MSVEDYHQGLAEGRQEADKALSKMSRQSKMWGHLSLGETMDMLDEFHMVADAVEPMWKGSGEKLRAAWIIDIIMCWARDMDAAETREEGLQEALGQISRMKLDPSPAINQTTLWAAIQIAKKALGSDESSTNSL